MNRYHKISQQLFVRNRQKLLKLVPNDALVIVNSNHEQFRNGDQGFPFRQHSDLFYLTGIDQADTTLLLCPSHPIPQMREILLVLRGDKKMEIWNGHRLTKEEATEISGVDQVKFSSQKESILVDLMYHTNTVYLNLNENLRYSSNLYHPDLEFALKFREKYPLHTYQRLAPLLTSLRLIKESEEIELIRYACSITASAFHRVLKFVKAGVMEYEIEAEITHEYIRNGCSGHSYAPIVASGADSCILHYNFNHKICKDGDILLMDFGAEYANYAADTTRTIPVNGVFTKRQKSVYESVLRVKNYSESMLIPGTTLADYQKKVCKNMEHELVHLGLISTEQLAKENDNMEPEEKAFFKYYMHGTSHFLGLDVHDVGTRNIVLQPGMVVTCEPGIYIPDEQIGIRLEDEILITSGKPENLFENHPIDIQEIEKLMKR